MRRIIIYIHGKGGNAEEANHYRPLFPAGDVVGFDYISQNPWDAKIEFSNFFNSHSKNYDEVILIANSIGAFFIMFFDLFCYLIELLIQLSRNCICSFV